MLMRYLYKIQKELDEFIRKSKNITKEEIELLPFVCLAAFVEAGEFDDEHKREKTLVEYVDILHFVLRINNVLELDYMTEFKFEDMYKSCKFNDIETNRDRETLNFITSFSKLVNATRCFKYWSDKGSEDKMKLLDLYGSSMFNFMALGNFMNFTSEEVLQAYLEKRNENFRRQEENY